MATKKICDICGGEEGVKNTVQCSRHPNYSPPGNIVIGDGVQFFPGSPIDICDVCVEHLGYNPENMNWLQKLLEEGSSDG